MIRRRLELTAVATALIACAASTALIACAASTALAGDLRYSVALGFGGTGIQRDVQTEFGATNATKSEGPGVLTLSVDYPLADTFSVGAEHSRGFRLGPFSAGVSFTGVFGRWYFMGPQAMISDTIPKGSSLFVRRIAPFTGLSAGVATGTITREGEVVSDVGDSGIYLGYRLGADYPLNWRMALRPELIYSTTISGTGKVVEFALQCGFVFGI